MLILGGIFLIMGAVFTFYGKINYAVIIYLLADIIWLLSALESDDFLAAFFIAIGALLGIGALFKMDVGVMRNNLDL